MEHIAIKLGNKPLYLEAKECRGIMMFIGLMFSGKNAKILIFRFNKLTRTPIHSFFCPHFIAVWIKEGKVVEYRWIRSRKLSITPSLEFDTLIEIPLKLSNKRIIKNFPKRD